MSYLDRLHGLISIDAAKRTPQEEAEDRRLLKEKLEKKETNKPKPSNPKPTPKKNDAKLIADSMLNGDLADPHLVFLRSDVTTTEDDKTEDVLKKSKKIYDNFLNASDGQDTELKNAIARSFNLLNIEDTDFHVHVWLCNYDDSNTFINAAFDYGLESGQTALDEKDLSQPNLIKKLNIEFKGAKGKENEIKNKLQDVWEPIENYLIKETPPEEKKVPEDKEEEEKVPEDKEEEEKVPEDKKEEEKVSDDDGLSDDYEHYINTGKFRSIPNPYILILDSRKHNADFQKFIDKSEKSGEFLANKALLFLVSKKLVSSEGDGVRVYFLNGKDANAIKSELEKDSLLQYRFGTFDKGLWDEGEPFKGLKVNNHVIDTTLTTELNNLWIDASSSVGNPIPAIQLSSSIPLDYLRFINKKQRRVDLYIGGRPSGVGYEGSVYALATEQEGKEFLKLVKRFKMPSLFYDRLSMLSDIDNDFKKMEPYNMLPANVLLLHSDKFKLDDEVKITDEIKPILDPNMEKITQLDLLHLFARKILKNTTKYEGAFVKNKNIIGTHILQFNADMSLCFMWGAITQHISLNPNEVKKQLPFVTDVNTSYL